MALLRVMVWLERLRVTTMVNGLSANGVRRSCRFELAPITSAFPMFFAAAVAFHWASNPLTRLFCVEAVVLKETTARVAPAAFLVVREKISLRWILICPAADAGKIF